MQCRIKRTKKTNEEVGRDAYFIKFLFFNNVLSKKDLKPTRLPICDWTDDIDKATIFKTKRDAEKETKRCRLKNIEYERVN